MPFDVSDLLEFLYYIIYRYRPSIKFSSDEAVACRLATNEIQFFEALDFSKGVVYRIRVLGVAAAELSRAPGSHIAAFIPESKVQSSALVELNLKDLLSHHFFCL